MEVEAQEDGVLAKILVCIYYFCSLLTQAPNGAKDIMVNKPIAFLQMRVTIYLTLKCLLKQRSSPRTSPR